jgi:hypothetical protein
MTDTIDTNTLRDWLGVHRPVTVLDLRSDDRSVHRSAT